MRRPTLVLSIAILALGAMHKASATLIDFDDMPGYPCGCDPGVVIPSQFIIDDEYLNRGVLFDSAGGGVYVAAASNAVSPPNTIGGLGAGGVIDYFAPIYVSFWRHNGAGALVDFVSITLTDSSDSAVMRAYDVDGVLLGSVLGTGSETMTVAFPGAISSVVILPSFAAFDDLVFSNVSVPAPAAAWLLGAALGVLASRIRRLQRTCAPSQ